MTEPRPLAPPRLLALLLLVGCKASAPESMVVAPEPAASPACDQLAQRLCEELELDCAELRVVLREHEVPEDGCQDALASADAMERAPELPPEMMPLAYAKLLLEILRRSPKAEAEHLAQLDRLATLRSLPPPSAAGLSAQERELTLECPPGTSPRIDARLNADATTWCERDDGILHGPRTSWSPHGVPLRITRMDEGRAVEVRYPMVGRPLEQGGIYYLPDGIFSCADGQIPRQRSEGGGSEQWCEDDQGRRQGVALRRSPLELITRQAIYVDDETSSVTTTMVDASPEVSEALQRLSSAYERADSMASLQALEGELEAFLAAHPDHPEGLMLLSQVQLELDQLDAALDTARRCTEQAPIVAPCWLTLAVIHETRGELFEAREGYTRYLATDPAGRYLFDVMQALQRLDR